MWMLDGRGGLAAVLYGASTVRARVGATGQPVEIIQTTDYPFGEEITFTIRTAGPVSFPFLLRVPAWCRAPQVALNDRTLDLVPDRKGWIRLQRTFRPNDHVVLRLPMHTAVSYWPNGRSRDAVGLEHGPLVYALPVREAWASTVTPRWSTVEFPEWDATPAGPWNYGMAGVETTLPAEAQLQRGPMTADPWVEPPVRLTVPLKRIPGWDLRVDARHADRRQTPPLPEIDDELSKALATASVEQVALVPYGATHLRLTVFPKV
ncbi:MAG: glycoside hydrolase family 127 protein [Alphaproteobacteria bacterium]|nr:glycoside hydrolase family 127 protein [Alphaproteobacteria bacterium]